MLKFLYKPTDNAPLIVFRIALGLLLVYHCISNITDNTVYELYVEPKVTFSFIGLEWLQPLPGSGMYWYYGVMALLAAFIAIGLYYRLSLGLFTVLWAGTYFMQKTVYNNHHYLLLLLFIFMMIVPANAYASVDSRLNPKIKRYSMPAWCIYIFVLQIAIVYFYAAVAKLYPDWMNGRYPGFLISKFHHPYVNWFTQNQKVHVLIAWGGILYDMLIVPALLYKKTRRVATVASIVFHCFNFIMLNIGIFPFLSLAYLVFFYPPNDVRWFFLSKKRPLTEEELTQKDDSAKNIVRYFFIPYFIVQLAMPLRQYFIEGDCLWTEEGHRYSWRMMLKNKKGDTVFMVKDKPSHTEKAYNLKNLLTELQIKAMAGMPDMIWQTAQLIKKEYAAKGHDVEIYVTATASVNRRPYKVIIDPKVDMAQAKWDYFGHNDWILLHNNQQ
jgi:vitamin K-dependent gamma-carboxylase